MLPELDRTFWVTLEHGLAELGLELPAPELRAVDDHVRLLMAWNASINLSALRSPEQIARGHILDSLSALPVLRRLTEPVARQRSTVTLLDLGSGGGFPGIPLALLLPVRRAALVDSVAKKARFLAVAARAVVERLAESGGGPGRGELEIEAIAERAEDLADEPDQREAWDLVVARAIGSVAEAAELGLPLLRRGGHVAIWKHDAGDGGLERELREAAGVAVAAGGTRPRIELLPGVERIGLAGHCLVTLRKERPTPLRFPRQAGERRRRPLLR